MMMMMMMMTKTTTTTMMRLVELTTTSRAVVEFALPTGIDADEKESLSSGITANAHRLPLANDLSISDMCNVRTAEHYTQKTFSRVC